VGFLARSRDRLRLRAALRNVKKKPTPQALCELVQGHLRLDDLEAAHQYSSWGLKRFPQSDLVHELHRIVARERAQFGLQEARRFLQEDRSPENFLSIARFALQLRDGVTAIQALEQCLGEHPTNLAALLGLAEMCERRYLRDLVAADAEHTVELLQRGSQLDQTNPDWRLRLARFYNRLGALGLARTEANEAFARNPNSSRIREFLRKLPAEREGDQEDLETHLRMVEERGFLEGFGEETLKSQRELERVRLHMDQMAEEIGASRSVVLLREGEAYDSQGSVARDSFVGVANSMLHSAQRIGRNCGMGPMRGATLETAGGSVVLRAGFRSTVAVLLGEDVSVRGSQEALGRLLSGAAQEGGAS
jgi:hypothetical protein